ncbi:hypothetical protein ACFVIM_33220 [Streptomyces sp. NPDC057638]|uniref:hypothetical protein n=1 Tax=Streptomyces sp. NPDC057638 TaxID=3346190 RepID=UPI0036990C6F
MSSRSDRSVTARRDATGENHAQALNSIRTHGLRDGVVPDAADPGQQRLEAALLHTLARPRGPLPPHDAADLLFGIAKASPSPAALTLWAPPGTAAELLARLLPATTTDGTVTGVPTLRWTAHSPKHLALHTPHTPARVLLAATSRHARDAAGLLIAAGLHPLTATPGAGETAAWDALLAAVGEDAPGWSRALRRPALAQRLEPGLDRATPHPDALDSRALAPRPHGPAAPGNPAPRVIRVVSEKGGTGCSWVSVLLAYGLVRAGHKVALLTEPHLHPASEAAGEVWRPAPVPPGDGRLLVAPRGEHGEDTGPRLVEAGSRADIVITDTPHGNGRPGAGETAADLTVLVQRDRPALWRREEVTDRRPAHIRAFAWLDGRFPGYPPAPGPAGEAGALLNLLDYAFLHYALFRTDDSDGPAEADGDLWEELTWGGPGHAEDVLPPEGTAPLERWRAEFLTLLDPDGARHHPALWQRARAAWPAHNRRRNLQRLGTDGALDFAELNAALDRFTTTMDAGADPRWTGLGPERQAEWRTAQLTRWLDERFAAHLRLDTAHHPRTPEQTLLAVLDTRYIPYAQARLDDQDTGRTLPPAPGDPAADRWWDPVHAAAPFSGPQPVTDTPDGWRDAFLAAADAAGTRRHGGLWQQVRATWPDHNKARAHGRLAPFEATPAERDRLRPAFVRAVREAAGPAWDTAYARNADRWIRGERTEAESLERFDDLVERNWRAASPQEVADGLLDTVHRAPEGPWMLVANLHRPTAEGADTREVATALHTRGPAGFATVRSRAPRAGWFEAAVWTDPGFRTVQQDLADRVHAALNTPVRPPAPAPSR